MKTHYPCAFIALLAVPIAIAVPAPIRAADRRPGIQEQTQLRMGDGQRRGFFSRLFGGRNDESRRLASKEDARRFLQPSRSVRVPADSGEGEIVNRPTADTSMLIIRSHDNKSLIVQPLLNTVWLESRAASEPRSTTTAPLTTALDLAIPATGDPPAPVQSERAPERPTARAAVPLFANPVPDRPGLVYPPGLERLPTNIVDVTGLTPGSKARDPLTKIIFLVP